MKKIIVSVLTIFTFGLTYAQEIDYGVKGGLNIANLTGDIEDAKSKVGLHVGGFVQFKVNEKFSVQPELLYSQQGAKTEYIDSDGFDNYEVKATAKLDYLNIPIMAKYFVAENFSLQAGPQIAFLLSGKEEYEIESFSITTDIKDRLNKVDFGFNFGLGYEFSKKIFADARYNLGLSNITKEDEMNVKNNVIQISVGYKF